MERMRRIKSLLHKRVEELLMTGRRRRLLCRLKEGLWHPGADFSGLLESPDFCRPLAEAETMALALNGSPAQSPLMVYAVKWRNILKNCFG
jgi:hypothetical protein